MRSVRLVAIGALVTVIACSGDQVPDPAAVAGTWSFTYANVTGSGVTCNGTLTFTITQSGDTFAGQQVGAGTVSCTGAVPTFIVAGATDSYSFGGETMYAGIASSNQVAFALGLLQTRDAGTVTSATVMSGTTTWELPVKPRGTVTLNGTWSAVKE